MNRAKLVQRLTEYCSAPALNLAALRVALGVACAFHVLHYWSLADVFIGHDGIFPAKTITRFTLFKVVHDGWPTDALFLLCVLVALGFSAGVRGCKWVLPFALASMRHRIPVAENGADATLILALICCWMMPLESVFSVERYWGRKQEPIGAQMFALGYPLLLLQLSVNYFYNAINKLTPPWLEGIAVERSLSNPLNATWLGAHMAAWPSWIWELSTYMALATEFALPVLLLSPFFRRHCHNAAAILMLGLHGFIVLTLAVGMFGWAMLAHVPLLVRFRPKGWKESSDSSGIIRPGKWGFAAQAAGAAVFLVVMAWSLDGFWHKQRAIPLPATVQRLADWLRVRQGWGMFSWPSDRGLMLRVEAVTESGKTYDPWRAVAGHEEEPSDRFPLAASRAPAFAHTDIQAMGNPTLQLLLANWSIKNNPYAGDPVDELSMWMHAIPAEQANRVDATELKRRVKPFSLPLSSALPVQVEAEQIHAPERVADGIVVPEGTPVFTPVGASFTPECAHITLHLKRPSVVATLFIQADAWDRYVIEGSENGTDFFEVGHVEKAAHRQYRSRLVRLGHPRPLKALRLHHQLSRTRSGFISELALLDHDVELPALPDTDLEDYIAGPDVPSVIGVAAFPVREQGQCVWQTD